MDNRKTPPLSRPFRRGQPIAAEIVFPHVIGRRFDVDLARVEVNEKNFSHWAFHLERSFPGSQEAICRVPNSEGDITVCAVACQHALKGSVIQTVGHAVDRREEGIKSTRYRFLRTTAPRHRMLLRRTVAAAAQLVRLRLHRGSSSLSGPDGGVRRNRLCCRCRLLPPLDSVRADTNISDTRKMYTRGAANLESPVA